MPTENSPIDEVVVVGHRNPDNDSICAAVGYAHLMSILNPDSRYIACRQGPLPDETLWVLDRFEVPAPHLITHIHSRIRDAMSCDVVSINQDDIMLEAGRTMRNNEIRAVVVTDDDGKYIGLVTERKLADMYIDEVDTVDSDVSKSKLADIAKACDGKIILGDPEMVMQGHLRVAASEPKTFHEIVEPGDIVVMGDRMRSQKMAVEAGVACLILAVGAQPDEGIVELARQKGTAIICAERDTYTVTRLTTLAQTVGTYVETDACIFDSDAILSESIPEFLHSHQREAVVLNDDGKCIGIITRSDVAVFPRRKVILVDHNEKAQSLPGIDEADLVGIVDHHRVGDIQTTMPINFISLPWGSSSTIVAEEYRRTGVDIPYAIAGVLLSAILTDTVLLKSPTTTQVDRDVAQRLGQIIDVDPVKFGIELFHRRGKESDLDIETMVTADSKEFEIADQRVLIAQHETADLKTVMEREAEISEFVSTIQQKGNYDTVLFLLTDIIDAGSMFFASGNVKFIERAFGIKFGGGSVWVDGILSRKKQVVAKLMRQDV